MTECNLMSEQLRLKLDTVPEIEIAKAKDGTFTAWATQNDRTVRVTGRSLSEMFYLLADEF